METTLQQAIRGPRTTGPYSEAEFQTYVHRMQQRFLDLQPMRGTTWKVFRTDAKDLFERYLASFPLEERQYHNCSCCRRFINRYGGLVHLTPEGGKIPLFWDETITQGAYAEPVRTLRQVVEKSNVTGVFLTAERTWGSEFTGNWSHFAVTAPIGVEFQGDPKKISRFEAKFASNLIQVRNSLLRYPTPIIAQTVRLLKSAGVNRSERFLATATWFLKAAALYERVKGEHQEARDLRLMQLVAYAPDGFCRVGSSVLGTLMDDLMAEKPLDRAIGAFNAKVDSLNYQRPKAPPKSGNIDRAERLIEENGLAEALNRRFAKLGEIPTIWKPTVLEKVEPEGVFGHLRAETKPSGEVVLPNTQAMTWVKFRRDVLPEAKNIDWYSENRAAFSGIVTQLYPDAKPILVWDDPKERNPFSWFQIKDSSLVDWGLKRTKVWHRVTAITTQPSSWTSDRYPQFGESVFLLIEGMKFIAGEVSACLFPEILRSDLHEIRSTIEAHSKKMTMSDRETATACGIRIIKGLGVPPIRLLVVFADGASQVVTIDRWE